MQGQLENGIEYGPTKLSIRQCANLFLRPGDNKGKAKLAEKYACAGDLAYSSQPGE